MRLMYPHPTQERVLRGLGHPKAPQFIQVRCGRRWGKTSLGKLFALKACVDFPAWSTLRMGAELILANSPLPKVFMIVCPDKSQAKELYWDALLQDLDGNPLVKKTNSTELTIKFHGNRPNLMLKGANDREGDTIRGNDILGGVFDEFQDWNYQSFTKVITPAMSSTYKSQALIMGTPKGKGNNPMYLIHLMAEQFPQQYATYHFFATDNPTLDRNEIEQKRATLPARDFRQEYEASFEDFPGRIWAELDHNALVTTEPAKGVRVLGVDWGDVNPAFVVWNWEADTGTATYLDGWVNYTSNPICFPEQLAIMRRLCLDYDVQLTRCDPSRPADILELQEKGLEEGILGLRNACVGENAIKSGNSYVHGLIHQNRFKVLHGSPRQQLDGMHLFDRAVAYHRKQLRDGSFVDEPAPGQDDHVCDATRYALFNPD